MQADGDPERGGSLALSHASNGSLGSPMAGRDLSAPRGSSGGGGGGSGWRRRPGRACTWRRRLLPPSGRKLRVHPGAGPLMGTHTGKTQWREGRAGCEGRGRGEQPGRAPRPVRPGRGDRRAPCGGEAWARRGAAPVLAPAPAPAPWAGGPSAPHGGAQTEPGVGERAWHTRAHPSRHCSCLPASFPKPCPFSSPHPHPHPRRGCFPVTRSVCLQI